MPMSEGLLANAVVAESGMLAAGVLFGFGYFRALRWTTQLYGTRRVAGPAMLTLARLFGAALFLGFAARMGALALLTGFLGFLVARGLAMHAVRRAV